MRDALENRVDDGEISLLAVWRMLWVYKYLIVFTIVVASLAAVYIALTATPIYRTQVVVTEAGEQSAGGISSLASQLGNLAGVNLRSNATGQEAVALLHSRRLVEEFITRKDLVDALVGDQPGRDTLWWASQRFIEEVIEIAEDARSGTIAVVVEWPDPNTAATWANDFVALANDLMRTRAMEEASRSIAYLEKQLERTNVVELRRALYNLIEGETRTLMLTNARTEYSFKVIDPARPPEFRVRPWRTLIVVVGGFVGFLVGAIAAFVLAQVRSVRTDAARLAEAGGPP